ncbi:ABC transporter permease [Methylobacter sp.]|uniref:ABC transporter permease n=1 Tax=Methylobacter sp. TaxID=2051955 RepID=UPI0011FA7D65|nr:ABC transporter permease [Methylobacter sp.]TAK64232.1 MAG: ABC transporter permease [Methylobacter sp.]
MPSFHQNPYEVVIKPPTSSQFVDVKELIRFRGLLRSMSSRQVRAEFGDLHLGIFWVLARPLLMTVIFVFFRRVSNANIGASVPYAAYLYSGLILWFFFTESVSRAAASISTDGALMQKVYFPRLLSPLSSILAQLSGLAIASIPLFLIMGYYGLVPGWNLMLLPVVLLQTMLLAFGTGCLFAALATLSRDWERLLSLLLYIGLFVSPVIFAPDMLPKAAQSIHMLNPMSGALLGFRATLFSDYVLPANEWFYSLLFSGVLGLVGVYAFQRAERTFMDRI